MHRPRSRLAFTLSCLCASAAACGSDPATSASASDSDSNQTDPGTATAATAATTAPTTTTGDDTAGETTPAPTDGGSAETTATAPITTTTDTTHALTTEDLTATDDDTGTSAGDDSTTDPVLSTGDDDTGSTGDDDTGTSTGDDDPWGCERGDPFTVNGEATYTTLEAAVAAAPPNATITVCPGMHPASVTIERPLTLIGAGADKTFLDGGDTTTPIFIKAVSVTIEGFTFQHGKAVHNPLGNSLCGGAVAIDHTYTPMTVTIKDSVFTDNHGQFGGAICYDGDGDDLSEQKLVLDGVTITGNSATGNGGGLFSYSSTTMTDTTIVDNEAGGKGGGIYFSYSDNVISGGVVKQNTAGAGGGMFLQSPVTVDVSASDWGFGQAQENVPNDVEHDINEYGFFGANVSFFCKYVEWNQGMCNLK